MNLARLAGHVRDAAVMFSGAPEQRAMSWEDWASGYGPTYSGKTVTTENAVQLTTVWACVTLISDSVASATPETYRGSELITAPQWMNQPNQDMSRFEFLHQSTVSALLDGNAFWYAARAGGDAGTVKEIFLLDPGAVTVDLDPYTGKRVYRINGEVVKVSRGMSGNLVHVPGFVLPGSARGLSPIEAARQAVGLGMSAEEFGARFFANSATLSGVIEVPGGLEPDQAKVMAQSFATNHQGLKKSHLPGVLTGGATWRAVTVAPEQAQFLETRKYQTAEIARLYRVPPHLVGDVERSTSWGTGIEEQNRNFIQYTLSPWTIRFESALSALLPQPQVVKFNMSNLLRGTKKERYETYDIGINSGFLTPDEARAEEGMAPLPDGMGAMPRMAPNDSPFSESAPEPDQSDMLEDGGSDESE